MADGKREIIKKYASAEEDVLMLAKVMDKYTACNEKNYIQTTRFLSLHDCIIADTALKGEKAQGYVFWGGYECAERKLLVFYPDYLDSECAVSESGVNVVRARFRPGMVSHRDMLGSLMNIGISRECLGDLLVHEDFCDIICVSEATAFIMENLFRAGRETLKLELLDGPPAGKEEKYKLIKDTVASLRLDAIVSAGCSVSRGNAAALISSGRVKVNDFECIKADKPLCEGDCISVRGYGKLLLESVGGMSRKGRTIITIKKFV
ncbi:MAG: YlmH/Sll1252 family protein [Clostridiales bacterium]|nr:YlmH/Sll1252 family protein [Clostridiales bacterium]